MIAPGDRFLGLEVVSVDVARSLVDSGYVGIVAFRGERTVSGHFRHHPDSEVEVPCFFVDSTSAQVLPRFPLDERIPWFCFTNSAEVQELPGYSSGPRAATIVIADFKTVRQFTDAYDTARFVRLVRWADEDGPSGEVTLSSNLGNPLVFGPYHLFAGAKCPPGT